MEAKVISINTSEKKGTKKKPIQSGEFIKDFGLNGDSHAGNWHRQVSLLAMESIDKIKAKLPEVAPGDFAENITTTGIILHTLPIGTKLRIGETLHEVTQIGKECHTNCEIYQQTGDCVMPREGIFTKVLSGGTIKPGDKIEIIS